MGGLPSVQAWMIETAHNSVRWMVENTAMSLKLNHQYVADWDDSRITFVENKESKLCHSNEAMRQCIEKDLVVDNISD